MRNDMNSLFDLNGKIAVVTGATRGIGIAMTLALAEAGADIVGVSRTVDDESEVAVRTRALGRRFTAIAADLGTPGTAAEIAREIDDLGLAADIFISNAAVVHSGRAEDVDDVTWRSVIDTNLTAPFLLARELGRGMIMRGRGKIVFVASALSFKGSPDAVAYTSAKTGVIGLMRSLANEWGGYGINVNALAPGYVETDMTTVITSDPAGRKAVEDAVPLGRWGAVSDFAGPVVFLASAASDYVHGAALSVDGGLLVR